MRVDWPAPGPRVGAAMSTRSGGVSVAPWQSLNLGSAVGDDAPAVAENRARFAAGLEGAHPVYLRQVHGTRVVRLRGESLPVDDTVAADAALTTEPHIACVVQVADCLPVLLADSAGRAVAAAHAGWRGLAAGVLDATVAALRDEAGCSAQDLVAWLGPCIGPRRFEVGDDVRAAFSGSESRFVAITRRDGTPGWLADLAGLADDRLRALGVGSIDRDGRCTVEVESLFFSFRRDGVTGRLAAAVWLRG